MILSTWCGCVVLSVVCVWWLCGVEWYWVCGIQCVVLGVAGCGVSVWYWMWYWVCGVGCVMLSVVLNVWYRCVVLGVVWVWCGCVVLSVWYLVCNEYVVLGVWCWVCGEPIDMCECKCVCLWRPKVAIMCLTGSLTLGLPGRVSPWSQSLSTTANVGRQQALGLSCLLLLRTRIIVSAQLLHGW